MNAPSNLPATRSDNPIDKLKANINSRADEFKMALPSHITVDKFQRTVATAAMANATLLTCDRASLLLACMKLAQDGLLPDGREAALVPFKNRVKGDDGKFYDSWQVQAMPMAWGLRKKILQSGEVVSLETGVVYRAEVEGGNFLYEIGIDPPIRHRPKLDMTDEEMGDENIIAAYSIARLKNANGDPYWSVEVMRRSEINKVRQTSQTGAVGRTVKFGKDAGKPIEPKGPWVDWFGEMARKTVLRRHSKVLPMSGDILDTLERDDAEELRVAGAAHLLQTEEHKPLSLPTNEELDGQGERIDPNTGEVLNQDPGTGMSEVDEETARALDAGDSGLLTERDIGRYDDTLGRTVTAEDVGTDDQAVTEAEEEKPAWWPKVEWIRKTVAGAKNKQHLREADDEFVKARAGLPDDVIAEIDGLIAAKRAALTKPMESAA